MRFKILLMLCCMLPLAATLQAQTNNAELRGDYAFAFTGVSGNTSISSAYAAVGRFTADGAGNLTNGEVDTNGVAGSTSTAQAFTGTYSIGPDHRGVMNLNIGGSPARLAFAMTTNGNARFIKFDAAGGSGTIGAGTIEKADSTAYTTSRIAGDYTIGVAGQDNVNNRAAIIGRFTANGAGTLANPAGDLNAYGTPYAMAFTSATYSVSDTAHGRGTMNLTFTFGGAPASLNFVFYVVNSAKVFVMARDLVTSSTPLLSGTLQQQQHPAGGFSNASLNGNMVMYLTGLSVCGSGSGVPKAVAGLLTAGGNGTLSLTYDENYCRAPGGIAGFAGTYTVAANGRATITLGGYHLVGYLVSSNKAFWFVSDSNVLFGLTESQAPGTYTSGALNGAYAGSATDPVNFAVKVFSGEFTANGSTLTGTQDIGASSGSTSGAAFNSSYSVSSSPTNGRGIMTITSGSGGTAVIYMISSTKFVVVPLQDPNPSVWIFEQSAGATTPPPAATLSALTLNPTTLVGGAQSATGTVTLSAAAPAGGAQVALSSSNTSIAGVPSSVTVAAGATTATFTVATSAVSSSTTVSISASYSGATRSASLTVTPPPRTIVSLSLNPSSVVGGVQSSTGTVTLSGPAPTGGAQVALSSSNASAARVPSILTVPVGATAASFTVNTSAVLLPTNVTITASLNNTTRSATLSVW